MCSSDLFPSHDIEGNKGKTALCKYLVVNKGALYLTGKCADIKYGITQYITEKKDIVISNLNNMVIEGNSVETLQKLPEESINLIFTSPPYYNAKPEYSEYSTYDEYLELMRKIIKGSHRVLSEGRFFVINISPELHLITWLLRVIL